MSPLHAYFCPECDRPATARDHQWGCPGNVVRLTPDEARDIAAILAASVYAPAGFPVPPALPDSASEDLQYRARQEWEDDQRKAAEA